MSYSENNGTGGAADGGVTTLGIRVPDDLREKIREAARLEERTESSFARFYLGKAADAVLGREVETEGRPE